MTDTSLHRVKEVFLTVADLPPEEQPAALDRACAGDRTLRDKIARMLAAERGESGFLDQPALLVGEGLLPDALRAPERVGPYRVRELLGEGGFGSVYRAEQDQPIRREVALKIIKPGMGTRGVIARFEAERQTVALLDHPGIAKVHDAGATESGQPYFVMELIRGEPVTDYCDRAGLSIPDRLRLFLDLCHAVQHAHQKGVIHRDLKPSNVLVQSVGDRPVAKIIDFGIAKAIDESAGAMTMLTVAGQMVGTPDYMSPEQADPSRGDADTRSDIYALGVLLYELLAGATPLGIAQGKRSSLAEITRTICEKEPARPSARLEASGDALRDIASARATEPRRLINQIRGDLDWIVVKALEKDRARRYETAQALAADIVRHLANEPVLAGPPSTTYRARKFVRRHRVGVVAASAVLLAICAGVVGIGIALSRALEAEVEASLAQDEAEAVNNFLLEDILASAHTERVGPKVTVVEAMGDALASVGERFKDQPIVAARIRYMIGAVYHIVGMYDESLGALRPAWEAEVELLGPDSIDTLTTQRALALVLGNLGELDESESLLRDGLDHCRTALGEDHLVTLQTEASLGDLLQFRGDYAQAEPMLRRTIESLREVAPDDDPTLLAALAALTGLLQAQDRVDEAAPVCLEALERTRARFPATHPASLAAMNNAASLLMKIGRSEEALPICEELLAAAEEANPPGHWEIAWVRYTYAVCLQKLGRLEEAAPVLKTTYPEAYEALGRDHMLTDRCRSDLVKTLDTLGDPEVLGYNRLDVEARMRIANPDQQESVTKSFREYLARFAALRPDEPADTPVRLLSETAQTMLDSNDDATPAYLSNFGWALTDAGFFDEAERWLLECRRLLEPADGSNSVALASVDARLTTLRELRADEQ